MVDWMILALVKIVKITVLGIIALASSLATSATHCSENACVAPAGQEPAPLVLSVEVMEADAAAVEAVVEVKRMLPPIRIETVFSPDLLVPPKVRDLGNF